jgi:hypothetical protein
MCNGKEQINGWESLETRLVGSAGIIFCNVQSFTAVA